MAKKPRYVLMNNGVEVARRPSKTTLQNLSAKDNLPRTPAGQRPTVYIEDMTSGDIFELREGGWFQAHH